jgi:glucose/arabinose dehydrogenase
MHTPSSVRLRSWWLSPIAFAAGLFSLWSGACGGGGSSSSSSSSSTSTTSASATSGSGTGGAGSGSGSSGSSGGAEPAGSTTSSGTGGASSGTGGSGAGGAGACPPEPTGAPPPLKLTPVATGLSKPVLALGAPGDPSRLYIVEQTGLIKILRDGRVLPDPFLSTVGVSNSGSNANSERGLLGLAFHPSFQKNGRLFIYYTSAANNGAITIAEYARSASDPDRANPQPTRTLLQISEGLHPWGNHNGGMIAFGPDGYLYAGVGDGGGAGDPNGHGQDTSLKLGKMLRLDVDNHPAAPPGNLPADDPHVWDYGLRNPWRFSFDRCTGDMYIGDVGQGAREEIDVEPAGQGHKNYGWNTTEGARCFEGSSCDMSGITAPVLDYPHNSNPPYAGKCSVTGGYVYRGSSIPNLVGTYFYADYCSNQIFTLVWKNGALVSQADVTGDLESSDFLGISSFGEDARGELYVVDIAGAVYRIDAE